LDVLYGGPGIGKWVVFDFIKKSKFCLAEHFFQFLVIKTLDPDRYSSQILDPDQMNADPQPCDRVSSPICFELNPVFFYNGFG
jgi:hypothetical protein